MNEGRKGKEELHRYLEPAPGGSQGSKCGYHQTDFSKWFRRWVKEETKSGG